MNNRSRKITDRRKKRLQSQAKTKLDKIEKYHNILSCFGFFMLVIFGLSFVIGDPLFTLLTFVGLVIVIALFVYYLKQRRDILRSLRS